MPNDRDHFDLSSLNARPSQGRLSATDPARRIGLSKSPTQVRMKRLEENGTITGYDARLDRAKMGQVHVAFAEVRLSDIGDASLQAFDKAVLAVPEVEECHRIASRFHELLKVRTSDIQDYRREPAERLSALPQVASTFTYVEMAAAKAGIWVFSANRAGKPVSALP